MTRETRAALGRAKARLDRLDLYPRPVGLGGVRIVVLPWLFRLPRMRRYDGYALPRTILLRHPPGKGASDDLVTHELCHIWQMQHHPLRLFRAWLTAPYEENPFELEARAAAAGTRSAPRPRAPAPAA
jgi:hypothetical protein